MRVSKKWYFLVLVLFALTLAGASPAMAVDSGSLGAVSGMSSPLTVVHPMTLGCYTSFLPNAPQGRPMDQYYNNCTTSTTEVCPANIDSAGFYHIDTDASARVGPSSYVVWHWNATKAGTNYTTVFCDANVDLVAASDLGETVPSVACNTSFNPGAPQGLPMYEYYRNCGSLSERVLPAYWYNGGLDVGLHGCLWAGQLCDPHLLSGRATEEWYWPKTQRNAQYTVVFADETGVVSTGQFPD
jgi:hypothetical protein